MEEKEEELVKRCVKNKTRITKRKFLLAKQSYLAERKVHKIAFKNRIDLWLNHKYDLSAITV